MSGDDSEDEAFEAEIAQREAFAARFPPEAFESIAQALKVSPTTENVATIRGWLIPYLEKSFSGNIVKQPSVPERRKELRQVRDALALVERASRHRGAISRLW